MKRSHQFSVRGAALISINFERKVHHQRRAEWVREWRRDAFWEVTAARIPHMDQVTVIARPFQAKHRLQDAGNCLPTVKAIIDALVDAKVLDDDGPEHVRSLTLMAPERTEASFDRVEIEIIEGAL